MLYIIRHGKTEWNSRHKVQGRTDIPLNDEGRKMAEKAAKEYMDVHFDICYCSPLCRAKETADILLAGRNVPIVIDERLAEMSFGVCEGDSNIYGKPDHPMYKFFMDPENYTAVPEGAESFEQLFSRTASFLRELALPGLSRGEDILIVGHGAMNSSIICQVKGLELKDFWKEGIDNCRLMKL